MSNKMNKRHRKLVLLGKSSVGKTTIVDALRGKEFNEYQSSTVGAAYDCIELDKFKVEIWDTAGQERFLSLSPMYYRGANIILLVFDVTELLTINRLYYYLDSILEAVTTDYRCIVVGSKCDLISWDELERIEKDIIFEVSKYNSKLKHPLEFIFISSKEAYNIDNLKEKIIVNCRKTLVELDIDDNGDFVKDNKVRLSNISKLVPDKCSCG